MKIILATASDDINQFVLSNIEKGVITGIASSRRHLLKTIKVEPPDVVVLSTLLSGEEDFNEIIFKTLEYGNCRIILLVKNEGSILQDAFYLGVRDYLFDPINPSALLNRINNPMSFKEAAAIVKPGKRGILFNNKMNLFFKKHIPDRSELSVEAQEILRGILKYIGEDEQATLEDNLYLIEQAIVQHPKAAQ